MNAMIINTTDTSSLNALITLALKQTIHAAVEAAIEDKLADLDAATAGVAAKVIAIERFTSGLEKRLDILIRINAAQEKHIDTALAEQMTTDLELRDRINKLEKRLDTLSLINTAQEDALNARIQVLEDEVGRLQHANEARDQEREDIIADMIDTRLEYALEDLDLTEQVRNVLSDATITI